MAFAKSAIEMWAIGTEAAYHLYMPKLYSIIIPDRCVYEVDERRQKVMLQLYKQADAAWRFLKG